MAPPRTSSRASTPTKGNTPNFTPANDALTHRDLLMFEERLKTNAAMLKRRRSRYQLFLIIIILLLFLSSLDVIFATQILIAPVKFVLTHVKPPYGPFRPLEPHPYYSPGVCLTAGTTLFLFFAGGFWAEKIGYANKYVSHANKTLRSFNMYLNVRPRPMSSMWIMRILRSSPPSPLADMSSPPPTPTFRRPYQTQTWPEPQTQQIDLGSTLNVNPVTSAPPTRPSGRPRSAGAPITPIPPPTNPRGELIFNSRVDKGFRESYERYRTAFERAKDEQKRRKYEERAKKAWWNWFLMRKVGESGTAGKEKEGTPEGGTILATAAPKRGRLVRTPTGSRASTPLSSRKPSPAGSTSSTRRRSANIEAAVTLLESVPERKPLEGDLLLRRTPTPRSEDEAESGAVKDRQRRESFSFLLGRPGLTDE